MMISRKKMILKSIYFLIGVFFVPIKFSFANQKIKHKYLSKGLDLIHKVLSRPLDVSILHIDKCINTNSVDFLNHDGFKDYINSLCTVFNGHHHGEDEILFPTYEKKFENIDFSVLKNQHKNLHLIVKNLKEKINSKNPTIDSYIQMRNLIYEIKDLWKVHRDLEEEIVELDLEPKLSLKEQIDLADKLSKHGQSISKPANLILPFLIYNLDQKERDDFTSDMPWVLKKIVVPIIWKSKWEKMKPFLLK